MNEHTEIFHPPTVHNTHKKIGIAAKGLQYKLKKSKLVINNNKMSWHKRNSVATC